MRDRKKRNIIIGSLCCLLVFMGIGYALLSQVLNINGTATLTGDWNIYIASITEVTEGNTTTGKSISASVSSDKLTANFDVELLKPGDYVEYKVVVNNDGDINAVLRELIPTIDSGNMDTLLTHSIIQGQILKEHSSTEFTLKVRFDERATEIPENTTTEYAIQLIYEQYDGDTSGIVDGVVPVTANDCFTISDTGVITDYDYSCGTYVTIPAVVDGKTVTEIDEIAFTDANVTAYISGNAPAAVVAFDDEAYTLSVAFLKSQYGLTDEMLPNFLFMRGTEPTEQLAAYQPMVYKITTNGLETPTSSIEYLDLSQVSGLTKIADGAFASDATTQSLKYLNLEGVDPSIVATTAFDYSNLESLTIDTDLHKSFNNEFNATINTLRILPGSTNEIPDQEYGNSYKITVNNLIIGEGITRIGNNAFYGNASNSGSWNIKSVDLPETLIEIGEQAFGYSSITEISFPSSLKTIGARAFANSSLTTVLLPDDYELTTIGFSAFQSSKVTQFSDESRGNILYLENVDTIGQYAFANTNLEKVILRNVTTIDQYAFSSNSKLLTVYINTISGETTDTIGQYAFANGAIQEIIVYSIENLGNNAFYNNSIGPDSNTSWDVSNIKHIGENAFASNPLNNSNPYIDLCGVESIGSGAFTGNAIVKLRVDNADITYNGFSPTKEGVEIGNVYYYYQTGICN